MCLTREQPEAARQALEEALRISRSIDQSFTLVLAAAYLARLPGGDASAARDAWAHLGNRVLPRHAIEAHFVLWQTTRDVEHLTEALRLLRELRDNCLPEHRVAVMEDVPLHRDIGMESKRLNLA